MNQDYDLNPLQLRMQSQASFVFSWCLNGFVAFLCLILAFVSTRFVQPFATLFDGLGVEVPWPTRFLIATHSWLLPTYFVVLAALTFAKELWSNDFRLKRLISVRIFLAAIVMAAVVVFVLYLPLLSLASKLSDSK